MGSLLTHLDPLVLDRTLSSKLSIVTDSASHQSIPLRSRSSWNVDRYDFLGQPLFLRPPSFIHIIARLDGFPCDSRVIRIRTCPSLYGTLMINLLQFFAEFADEIVLKKK